MGSYFLTRTKKDKDASHDDVTNEHPDDMGSKTPANRGRKVTDVDTPDTAILTPPTPSVNPTGRILANVCPNTQEATPIRSNVNDNQRGNEPDLDHVDGGFEMVLSRYNDADVVHSTSTGKNRKFGAKHYHPVFAAQHAATAQTGTSGSVDNDRKDNTTISTPPSSMTFNQQRPMNNNNHLTRKNLTSLFNSADSLDKNNEDEDDDWDIQLESKKEGEDEISWDDDQFHRQVNNSTTSAAAPAAAAATAATTAKKPNETKFLRRLKRRNISKNISLASTATGKQPLSCGEESNTSAAVPSLPPTAKTTQQSHLKKKNGSKNRAPPPPTSRKPLVVPQFINQYDDDGSMPSNLTEPEMMMHHHTHRKTPSPHMITPPSAIVGPSSARYTANTSSSTLIMPRNRSRTISRRGESDGQPPPLMDAFSGIAEGESMTAALTSSLFPSKEEGKEGDSAVEDLLSLFRCNVDSTANNNQDCESWMGAIAACGQQSSLMNSCTAPLLSSMGGGVSEMSCFPQHLMMKKDGVELEMEKEHKFALEFQRNLLEGGIKLIYHESPSQASPNPNWIQSTVKLYLRRGYYSSDPPLDSITSRHDKLSSSSSSTTRHLQPLLAWATLPIISRMKSFGSTVEDVALLSDRNWRTLGVLDVHSILFDGEGGGGGGGGDENNVHSGATTKTSTGFFSITATNGAVHVFEAPSMESRDYVVRGIKSMTSRLIHHMIIGNMDGMNELYHSEENEGEGELTGELPRLTKPRKVISQVVHAYLDQL